MYSADTADQMVKMTLEGIEVTANIALKAGGEMTKSLAAALYAVLTDQKKVRGKTRLETLMKTDKPLSVFAINQSDLKQFCEEAKRYGVLYCVLTEKNNKTGICEIMVKSDDASKISRIIDKLEIASIDTKAIKEAIIAQREGKKTEFDNVKPISSKDKEELYKNVGFKKEAEKKPQSKTNSNVLKDKTKKPSVRKELKEIKESQKNQKRSQTRTKSRNKQRIKSKKKVR